MIAIPRPLVVLLALASACRATPEAETPAGKTKPLLCEDHADCADFGAGWRCVDRGCVANSPPPTPSLDDAAAAVLVGASHVVTATSIDPDGDPVTYHWNALGELGGTMAGEDGASMTFTPSEPGVHLFLVTASDAHATSAPAQLRLLAEPAERVRYVSLDDGSPDPTCGSFDTPCAGLDPLLERQKAAGAEPVTIMMATSYDPQGYRSCLELRPGVTVIGGLSPGSFRPEVRGRERTRIVCTRVITGSEEDPRHGHTILGGTLQDVTLTNEVLGPTPPSTFTGVAVGETPSVLRDVDVVATCNENCALQGVAVFFGESTFEGVEVRSETLDFYPLDSFVGVAVYRGALTFTQTPARDVTSGPRGGVSMRALAQTVGVGISGVRAHISLDGVRVDGGFGGHLNGIGSVGGTIEVRNSRIDLTAYGASAVHGLFASDCWGEECECRDGPTCTVSDPVDITLEDNHFELDGGFTSAGVLSCRGVGLWLQSVERDLQVARNTVRVSRDFTLSIGGLSFANATGAVTHSWHGNLIAVEGALANAGCIDQNRRDLADEDGDGLETGAFGLAIGATAEIFIAENRIAVGNLAPLEDVAPEQRAPWNVGMVLSSGAVDPQWLVVGNHVDILGGALSGVGINVIAAPVLAANNFVNGGSSATSTAVVLEESLGAALPHFENNTLVGGSEGSLNAAVIDTTQSNRVGQPRAATFVNNLLDAGDGEGRRMLVRGAAGNYPATLTDNVGQFRGAARTLRPLTVARVGRILNESSWLLLLANAGGAAVVTQFGATWTEQIGGDLHQRPLFASSGHEAASNQTWIAMGFAPSAVDGSARLGLTTISFGQLTEVRQPSMIDRFGRAHVPRAAVYGRNGSAGLAFSGLVFIEGAHDAVPAGLYTVLDFGLLGFLPPDLVAPAVDPQLLAASSTSDRAYVIDQTGAGPALLTYPATCGPNSYCVAPLSLPAPITGLYVVRSMNLGSVDEVVLTSGRSVELFVDYTPGSPLPPRRGLAICPSGATVSAVTASELDNTDVPWELAVGCSDGSLHVVDLNATADALLVLDSDTTSFDRPILALAGHEPVGSSIPQQGRLLAVDDRDKATAFSYTPANGLVVLAGEVLIANTAATNGSAARRDLPAELAGLTIATGADMCELSEAEVPHFNGVLTRRDAHLVNSPNACIDGGTVTENLDDIDGAGTRTDGAPDIGADEVSP